MSINAIIQNELVEDASSVWLLKGHREFGYSDGLATEKYLEKVFNAARDLGSGSSELESHIRDWPSEYHLTTKRAQLLSGFNFDRSLKVLEVGCGCGAITRYLGEAFDQVVSVEGSLPRARLAKRRTRDLPSVSVICAPFQEIRFAQKFDIIFAIGVYEYSASFVDDANPYDAVLAYFADNLTPNGIVVLAIENQFGLKYFNAVREDHLGTRFEGLEGYHRRKLKVRTFGKQELENRLQRHFPQVRFFYPYPDYKLPECVVSAEFLASERAGELISQMTSQDYAGFAAPLWDDATTALELARNGMLEFFANSFLVFAGRGNLDAIKFEQLAILYSSGRKSDFLTQTRVMQGDGRAWIVSKRSRAGSSVVDAGRLKMVETDTPWIDGQSLQTQVMLRARSKDNDLETIFVPCRQWVDLLMSQSQLRGQERYISGQHIDSIWSNVFADAGVLKVIDREWIWSDDVPLNVVVIRAIYDFLLKVEKAPKLSPAFDTRSGRVLIGRIAAAIGVTLQRQDFDEFMKLESEMQSIICGADRSRYRTIARWFLSDRPTLRHFRRSMHKAKSIASRVRAKFG